MTESKKRKKEWVWMPHAGHLCVGIDCRFHLSTYVGKYLVSTVGEYWPSRSGREIYAKIYDPKWLEENFSRLGDDFDSAYMKRFGYVKIGCDRKYETMVFKAKKYEEKNSCCPWRMGNGTVFDMSGYNEPADACMGHLKMCQKWSEK